MLITGLQPQRCAGRLADAQLGKTSNWRAALPSAGQLLASSGRGRGLGDDAELTHWLAAPGSGFGALQQRLQALAGPTRHPVRMVERARCASRPTLSC
jgi:hypothetical protein